MRTQLVVKSSLKGCVPQIINNLILIGVCIAISLTARFFVHQEMLEYNLDTVWTTDGNGFLPLAGILQIIIWALVLFGVYSIVNLLVYGNKSKLVFALDDQEKIKSIYSESFALIFQKSSANLECSRILDVSVEQSSIAYLMNTGSLTITFVRFVNAESEEEEVEIDYVKYPDSIRERILEVSSKHTGLKIEKN